MVRGLQSLRAPVGGLVPADECPADAGRSAVAGRWRVDDDAIVAVRQDAAREASVRAGGLVAIACSGLTKDYGQGHGIFDLDLAIDRGETFGFIGPNGAGKTTTIRLLMDLIRPTRGRAARSSSAAR